MIQEGIISQKIIHHMSASVDGMLQHCTPARLNGVLEDDNGRLLSGREAIAHLKKLQFEGVKKIPCSDECKGFDKTTGCPGHPYNIIVHDWYFETGNG